jgi:hypothetical protein
MLFFRFILCLDVCGDCGRCENMHIWEESSAHDPLHVSPLNNVVYPG